jgi:DNA-binding NarL/FixJ family response regulator
MSSEPASKKKIRVLIADQEGVFRLGLKKLFGLEDDLRVVAQAQDAAQAVSLVKEFRPDLVFVQADLAKPNPGDLLAEIAREAADTKIVVTASQLPEEESVAYVSGGASGVILKTADPAQFVKCARKVMQGEVWLGKREIVQMAKRLGNAQSPPARPRDTLTNREKTIISYLMQGWRNREIARHLSITEQTVKNHLRTVYDKLGVSDRLELVLYAIHQRLELPPVGAPPPPPKQPASKSISSATAREDPRLAIEKHG